MTSRRSRRARLIVSFSAAVTTCLTLASTASGDPGQDDLAATPPMGWNSWNTFGCDINEQLIRDTADAIVASGMRDAGYRYINIDDCWAEPERNAEGELEPHHERFPSGIKAMADYVHDKGLKLGIYTSAGTRTCADTMPGALGHEEVDARTFADWGVDYLKYDNCNNQGVPATERYAAMGEALRATGRPIVYSVCEWGENAPWEWAPDVGAHLWRTTDDIKPAWDTGNTDDFPMGVVNIIDANGKLAEYAGLGDWNDPDMLEVGVYDVEGYPGLTDTEAVAHFSMWSIMASPLIAGNDVRDMPENIQRILTNREVIAVNQDALGRQGAPVRDDGDREVWVKELADGSRAVALFNRGGEAATITTTAEEIGAGPAARYVLRDLWTHTETETDGEISAEVPSHGVTLLRVKPKR
ncbi:alpha-galactosidase [Saccharopolyspora sp. K220]|uniref:alpha-galactosidase n=1 Tax=Saccharopolyspora soli TaxID=2926618 RepID=UPI001F56E743|nr:alpha-galactosidase [Saccharopolyspora soli]MCI2416572.1 alpha-galactosidase [Saccharopolyspora soli]